MNILPVNQKALALRFPELLQAIARLPENPTKLTAGSGKDFQFTLGHHHFHPYRGATHNELVDRWVESLASRLKQPETLFAVTGFGDGTHLRALLKAAEADSQFFVGEQSPAQFGEVLSRIDCSDILADTRCIFATGPINQSFFKTLSFVEFNHIKNAHPLYFSPLASANEAYYNRFLGQLAQSFEVHLRTYRAMFNDSGFYQETTIQNLPGLLSQPDVSALQGLLSGRAMVLVAAGPSLDESVDFLREAAKTAVIVVVNSAYSKLVRHGIKPHLTIAADPRESTFYGYENQPLDDVHLLCPYFVAPEVAAAFSGRTFTWSSHQQIVDYVYKHTGRPEPTRLAEMGTVTTPAITFAAFSGCKKIILVGQDLAVREDGTSHSKETFYEERGINQITQLKLEKCRLMPGNTLPKVHVESQYFHFLKSIEQLIEDQPQIEFINTARWGVKITGAPYMDYHEAVASIHKSTTVSGGSGSIREEIIQRHKAASASIQNHAANPLRPLQPLYEFVGKLLNLALDSALFHENLPEKFARANYANHRDIKTALSAADAINGFIDKHTYEYQIVHQGEGHKWLAEYDLARRSIHAEEPHWQSILQNKEFFWAVAESAFFLKSRLAAALNGVHCETPQTTNK